MHSALAATLYAPNSAVLAAQLPDIGAGLAAALSELARAPEPDRCETLAIRLNGAARFVMSLREATLRETEQESAS
jgi:hypothetical protein